jgi:hypothetical protein
MTEYEIQEQAAQYTIDPITIDHVTDENIADKMAEKNIQTLLDVNGNPIGYCAETIMSVENPGSFTTSQKTQVFLVPEKDASSTQDNVIINFKVIPREQGDNVLPGGQVIYRASEDAFTDTMKAAGYDIDLTPEMWNYVWEQYYQQDDTDGFIMTGAKQLIDSYTGVPGAGDILDAFKGRSDYAMAVMRMADVGGVNMPWVGNEDIAIARLLKTAADCGLMDVGQIMEDDPATKQLLRTLEAGDTLNLTPVGDRNGDYYDEEWVESFIKPMTMALMVNPSRKFPTDDQWQHQYLAWPDMTTEIPDLLDQQVYAAVNKHINIWCCRYGTGIWTGNRDAVSMWGTYIDPQLNWQIDSNYPEDRGYAIIHPTGTYYRPTVFYNRAYTDSGAFSGGGSEAIGNVPSFMLIYDQELFVDYLDSLGVNDASQLLNNSLIIFSNGTIAEKNPYSHKNRDDALRITVGSSIADIVTTIENDPVWPDNKITIPEYDPATDTTVNHYYYPITPGVDDPREINWPDIQLPDIVNPINEVVKYPTIPSQISLPIDNDPVIPTAGSSKFWTIYKPSDAQMELLGGELWQQNAIQILKQTFVNPTDGIISWSQVFLDPASSRTDYIYLGDYKTGVSGVPVVDDPKVYKYFGIIDVPRYFNDYRDYTETEVSVYLPFIGFMDLDSRDVIGCKITLEYYMDVITGTCVATLSPKVGDNAECCYQFTGNCGVQLPITAADRSRLLSGLLSGAVSGAKTGAVGGPGTAVAGAVLGGAIGAVSGAFGGVQKSNGFSANAGALTKYKTPYILIHRSIPADPFLYDQYYGNPASVTATLKNLHGFTRVRECYVDIPRATDAEKAMIEAQLKQGVILP